MRNYGCNLNLRLIAVGAVTLTACAANLYAAGQGSASFQVVADVFLNADAEPAAWSANYQASASVAQRSAAGDSMTGGSITLAPGYQATTEGFDTDGDGTPDASDTDSDADGIADASDASPYDTDSDGTSNLADADDDNDGLSDEDESGFGTSWVKTDTDADTQSDYHEWIAGTDGNNSGNLFGIANFARSGTGIVSVTWAGVAGRSYVVVATNTLTGSADWPILFSTNATGSSNITYSGSSAFTQDFYRLKVSRQ